MLREIFCESKNETLFEEIENCEELMSIEMEDELEKCETQNGITDDYDDYDDYADSQLCQLGTLEKVYDCTHEAMQHIMDKQYNESMPQEMKPSTGQQHPSPPPPPPPSGNQQHPPSSTPPPGNQHPLSSTPPPGNQQHPPSLTPPPGNQHPQSPPPLPLNQHTAGVNGTGISTEPSDFALCVAYVYNNWKSSQHHQQTGAPIHGQPQQNRTNH